MHALVPLLILVLFLGIGAVVGIVIYSIATDIASKTSKKMEKHNITVGTDGLKIGMKEMKNEDYVDRTQNVLVKVWNLSTWPAYKSRFWNKESSQKPSKSSSKSKASKSSSGSSPKIAPSSSSSSAVRHTQHVQHTSNGRLAEPRLTTHHTPSGRVVPGSFD